MGKKVRSSQKKGDRPVFNSNDFISRMPDDILLSILSRLPLKEAVVASSLSTRWRYMWCLLTVLDFDATEISKKIAKNPMLRDLETPKYINWVNRVIRQHKGLHMKALQIRFGLDKSSKNAIDKWIEYAISKRVQKLGLDLTENGVMLRRTVQNYVFPKKLFGRSLGKRPSLSKVTEIKFLTTLCLKRVNVDEEALGKILTHCPALEHLSIWGSADLVNLNISGRSLVLKRLEILHCVEVKSIEMCDLNLSFFRYMGPPINLKLNKLPMLNEIYIGEGRLGITNNVFCQLSCCIPNLRFLTFNIYHPVESIKLLSIPELPKLQILTLHVGAWDDDSLLHFTSLAKACPNLDTFRLQLIWLSPEKRRRKIRRVAKHPHRHLKFLKIRGYYGRISEVELAVYFIENAVSLERITIDPHCKYVEQVPGETDIKEIAARSSAKQQLEPITPKGVKLVIL